MPTSPFTVDVTPDWEALCDCIRRKRRPRRVHNIELFLDPEVEEAVAARFGLLDGVDRAAPEYRYRRNLAVNRFLGYDYVLGRLENAKLPVTRHSAEDTADMKRAGGRSYIELHKGPVTTWEEFENYPWPDPASFSTVCYEWYEKNLPEDMCVVGGGLGHYAEHLCWLMGYETLCFALFDQRDLVEAIYQKILEHDEAMVRLVLQFERVKLLFPSDDMGFRTGTLVSPDDLRRFVLPGHKRMAELAHAAGRPYLLHCCGQIDAIMPDLIDNVKIDAKHSFEDAIEPVEEVYHRYGQRVALLGGLDVDFLCRADERAIRQRVRKVLDACMPQAANGGYCLGTGNSVANYIPLDHYLAMLDEGRRWGR